MFPKIVVLPNHPFLIGFSIIYKLSILGYHSFWKYLYHYICSPKQTCNSRCPGREVAAEKAEAPAEGRDEVDPTFFRILGTGEKTTVWMLKKKPVNNGEYQLLTSTGELAGCLNHQQYPLF